MEAEGRIAKRQKLTNGSAKPKGPPAGSSKVFVPYRTVGLVSPTAVPFTTLPLGKTTFQITTSVGRSLQTYDLRKGLNLVFVTRPQTPEIITASATCKDKVLAAWGGEGPTSKRGVWVFKRGKRETELEFPVDLQENVKAFCVFGSWVIGVCDTELLVWKSSNWELYTTLRGISPILFTNCITNLPTYLNKILVGRQDGSAEIWNVSSGKLVYSILPPSTSYGAVTALEPTPALSLVAIAFESGPILIHDIKSDQTVLQFATPAGQPVTSITFRTDGAGAGDDGRKSGVMATASTATGDVTLWDLNNGGRKAGVLRPAHAHPTATAPGGVSRVEFLAGQAILVTSGLDNSLKTWIFDETPFNPVPRILHERKGHAGAVSKLMFLPTGSDGSDDTGKWLVSGSQDRSLWGWSLRRDGQSTEISQGAVQKKAKKQGLLSADRDSFESLKCPPVTAIACSLNRDGGIGALPGKHAIWQPPDKGKQVSAETSAMTGWESVLTAHVGDSKARTWFWGRKRAGRWAFPTGDGGNVTAIAMSPCGTFGFVGSKKGGIDMFNMQSGIHRQRFPARLTPMQAKHLRLDVEKYGLIEEEDDKKKKFLRGQGKHTAAVVGLAVDSLNRTVVSAGENGKVKFWAFGTGLLQHEIDWSHTQTKILGMRLHRESDLAAFACDDGCVRIVDISSQRLIRELRPSKTPMTELKNLEFADFCFSEDGRWIAACAGSLVMLWDLPTGHLIDAFKLRAPCTSLAFSPTGEFLATATSDSVGVDVWTNRALFTYVPSRHITATELRSIVLADEAALALPAASGEGGQNLLITAAGEEEDDQDGSATATEGDVDEISSDLLSLSLVPRSRWQNLLHLDLIRQRNKPTEAPKKPEKAPFFLPSLSSDKPGSTPNNALLDPTAAQAAADALKNEQSRVLKHSQLAAAGQQNPFTALLAATISSSSEAAYTTFLAYLASLPPAAADIEIRSLQGAEPLAFLRTVTWRLRQRRDFELTQAWMAVFLRVHGEAVLEGAAEEGEEGEELRVAFEEWKELVEEEMRRVKARAGYVSGLVGFLRAGKV